MSKETSEGEIESLRSEIASLKAMIAALGAVEDGAFDFVLMGSDDADNIIPPIGGGGMSNFEPKVDDEGKITIKDGTVCVGRKHYRVTSNTRYDSGQFRLKVDLSAGGAKIKIENGDGFDVPDGNVSYIPLYKVSTSGIVEDYRGNFCVPARE